MAEIVRRKSWGGVLPLGRHASISGSRPIHAPSVSIAPPPIRRSKTPVITTGSSANRPYNPEPLEVGTPSRGGFEIGIDGLSFWLMRIAREIGRGTSVQALRERRACQEWADARQAALPVQSLRPELH